MKEYVDSFIQFLTVKRGYSGNTIKNYQHDLDVFMLFLKKEETKTLDYQTIRKFLNYLSNAQYTNKSISRFMSTLRSFFHYLEQKKIINENPMYLITNPKLDKKLPNYLNYYEIDKLLDINEETPLGIRDSLIVELLYSTGIRVSELVNIKINDITDVYLKVLGKGDKERIVIFGPPLLKRLEMYLNHSRNLLLKSKESEYLLLNKNGERLTDRGIRYIINKLVKKTSINKKISPHTLRHTFATHMLDMGADLKVVQELLGHVSIETTSIYTHVTNSKMRDAILKNHPRSRKD